MLVRAARTYIYVLMAAETILLTSSLVIHLLVATGAIYKNYLGVLSTAVIVIGISTYPFRRKGVGLISQIKSCPQWMWKTAVAVAIYGIMTLVALLLFPASEQHLSPWVESAFPLGFEAIPICILYSVLWPSRLERVELIDSARFSFLFMVLGIIWALAAR